MQKRNIFLYLFLTLVNFGNVFSQNINDDARADSSVLERKEFLKNIQGTWILKETGSNWGIDDLSKLEYDQILIISENEIAFYTRKKDSQTLKLKTNEKIVPQDKMYAQNDINLVFSDRNIWRLNLKTNDILYFINTGELLKNGAESVLVCGIVENSYERVK